MASEIIKIINAFSLQLNTLMSAVILIEYSRKVLKFERSKTVSNLKHRIGLTGGEHEAKSKQSVGLQQKRLQWHFIAMYECGKLNMSRNEGRSNV